MAKSDLIPIEISDCSPININRYSNEQEEIFRHYATTKSCSMPRVFRISSLNREKQEEPVIYYNPSKNLWHSGRYIGRVEFPYKNKKVLLNIKPRFGETFMFKMFEELFNIKFTSGSSHFNDTKNKSYYLKILIAFIWIQKLSNCNRHGLPKTKITRRYMSFNIKGRLVIRNSAITHKTSGKTISENREKEFDNVIIRIMYHAYQILKRNYKFGELIKIPPNGQEAINIIEEEITDYSCVNEEEYNSIRYHPIYENFKDIVDFSWQIIKSQHGVDEYGQKNKISGFFIDVAEIWESYLRSKIKKILGVYGWQTTLSEYAVYTSSFYKRSIIPDIVMKNNNKYVVFDAKYKDMKYRKGDLDREDFFQIHTYISYLQTKGDVILGGLIYPVTYNSQESQSPVPLFETQKTIFIVDGPLIEKDKINFDNFKTKIFHVLENVT
jgi:5-methylcytosine-specific restriction enzyme subunit McrC